MRKFNKSYFKRDNSQCSRPQERGRKMENLCYAIVIFCLGVILGRGEGNELLAAIMVTALFGSFIPTYLEGINQDEEDEEDKIQEEEERRPVTRIVKNPYYNRYKP